MRSTEQKPTDWRAWQPHGPCRIVCLTEETTETLYALGEGDRVVGISAYTVRPPEATSKPRISAFVKARYDKILALDPDLVLAFSDLQADIAAELVRRGVAVFTFNQRSVAEILDTVVTLARIVGCDERGLELVERYREGLDEVAGAANQLPHRPRVFFEEWDDPLICGIEWVEELVEIAGGEPIYPELRRAALAADRKVSLEDAARRDPEVILASWCGKKVDAQAIRSRPGWRDVTAVQRGNIFEIDPAIILQPGPAALTDGVRELHRCLLEATAPGGPR